MSSLISVNGVFACEIKAFPCEGSSLILHYRNKRFRGYLAEGTEIVDEWSHHYVKQVSCVHPTLRNAMACLTRCN